MKTRRMKTGPLICAALLIAAAPLVPAIAGKPAAAVKPPVAGDWNSYVRVSPAGTYIVGNPAAPVKVIEHLSFTCPHCAAFSIESATVFRGQMIKSGSVEIEYRPALRDQADLAATLLLHCIGARRYTAASEAVFAHQNDWLGLAISFLQNDAHRFSLDPVLEQLKITAQLSGLTDLFRAQGMASADIDRCFTDEPAMRQIVATADASRKDVSGTPTFFINGVKTDAFQWSTLEPLLRAKGAK